MGYRNWLGIALVADIVGIVVLKATGNDAGQLDTLAFALATGLAGVTLPRGASNG